ncbi:MAG: S49 family peptidase [Chitinophagaceae bacterium]
MRYLDLIEASRKEGTRFSFDEKKQVSAYQRSFTGTSIVAPINRNDAEDHPGYEGKTVGILPVIGPMMKEDFCGWFGTINLRNELSRMHATESIREVVLWIDSPGGTVDGTEPFAEDVLKSPKNTTAIVDEMMCSAAYWLGSSAKNIVAVSKTAMIGSIGTMISFLDRTEQMRDNGIVLREYFADKSADKNKDFREAKDGNGRLLIENLLNPTNDVFLEAVKANRGDKLAASKTLTGKTFLSEQALEYGLIDEIAPMNQVINKLIDSHKIFV